MPNPSKPKRSYNSTRRKNQAIETRRMIIEAARKLFYELGYNNATIEAIAQQAGVAAETIYAVFGNKQAILMNLIQVTFAGEEENIPLIERPFIKDALSQKDQSQLIKKFSTDIYKIMKRMGPIFTLLRDTAKTDPEISAIMNKLLKDRLKNMSIFTNHLKRLGPVRDQILIDQSEVTVWAMSSAEVFILLTQDLGLSEEEYITWLSSSLERLLIPGY